MKETKILVFIEVLLSSNSQFGIAAASNTLQKKQKLILTSQHYLQQHVDYQCRCDAILMDIANVKHIEWVRNAFDA